MLEPRGNGFHDAVYRTDVTMSAARHEYLENQKGLVRRTHWPGAFCHDAFVTAALPHCLVYPEAEGFSV
jgi:hypothetical protein